MRIVKLEKRKTPKNSIYYKLRVCALRWDCWMIFRYGWIVLIAQVSLFRIYIPRRTGVKRCLFVAMNCWYAEPHGLCRGSHENAVFFQMYQDFISRESCDPFLHISFHIHANVTHKYTNTLKTPRATSFTGRSVRRPLVCIKTHADLHWMICCIRRRILALKRSDQLIRSDTK